VTQKQEVGWQERKQFKKIPTCSVALPFLRVVFDFVASGN
jgi:hypothetical protein